MKTFLKSWQGGVLGTLALLVLVAANNPGARLAAGHLFVGNSSGVATDTAITGDIGITSAGVTSIGSDKVATGNIVANTIVSADISTAIIQVQNCQLTVTQLENLRGTPVSCVAAPASGFANMVYMVEAWWDVTTTAETVTGSNDDIVLEYATSGADVAYITSVGFIDQSTDQGRIYDGLASGTTVVTGLSNVACSAGCLGVGSCMFGNDSSGDTGLLACATNTAEECVCSSSVTPAAAQALQLKNNGGGEFSGGNAANTLSVRVWYAVVPAAAFTSGG